MEFRRLSEQPDLNHIFDSIAIKINEMQDTINKQSELISNLQSEDLRLSNAIDRANQRLSIRNRVSAKYIKLGTLKAINVDNDSIFIDQDNKAKFKDSRGNVLDIT